MVSGCLAVAAALSLWYAGLIALLRRGLARIAPPGDAAGHTYSVVIAARNEERTIGRCVESVLRQTVSPERFEVIVVDDRSTDRTAAIVADIATRDPRVRLIRVHDLPAGISPKKNALLRGIGEARNRVIACTDADCVVPPEWLATIDRYMDSSTGLVQGMSLYARPEGMGRFLFAFQALDFVSHGAVAAGGIGAGVPLNANGNSIAYRRETFEGVGGFGATAGVLLGDDDLLLQRVWRSRRWKVRFAANRTSAIQTAPARSVRAMLAQRARWGSVSIHYGVRQILLLLGFFLFYLGTVAAMAAGVREPRLLAVGAAMLAVKMAGEFVIMVPAVRLYGCTALLPWLPIVSLLHLPMVLVAVIIGAVGTHDWKGQRMGGHVGGGNLH